MKIAGYVVPRHALKRIRERGFTVEEVRDALENPVRRYEQRYGKYKRPPGKGVAVVYQGPAVAVTVVERYGQPIITTVVYRYPEWWRQHQRIEAEVAIGLQAFAIFKVED